MGLGCGTGWAASSAWPESAATANQSTVLPPRTAFHLPRRHLRRLDREADYDSSGRRGGYKRAITSTWLPPAALESTFKCVLTPSRRHRMERRQSSPRSSPSRPHIEQLKVQRAVAAGRAALSMPRASLRRPVCAARRSTLLRARRMHYSPTSRLPVRRVRNAASQMILTARRAPSRLPVRSL